EVLHSHSYRYAEPFSGQSVVVLGAKASGLDISIELAKVGAQVTLSHGRPRLTFPLPSGIRQSSPVVAVQDDGSVRFQDGSVGRADVLMFCTGYNFRYTFLDADQLRLEIQDHMVSPLYRFLTPPALPSLFFIGICKIICPFPNFDCQEEENRQIQERDDTTKGKMKLKSQRQQQETSVSSGSYPQVLKTKSHM
ncbi:flavin-containing monooxygenase FMO GS-OX-like 7, partial [Seriola lalandi dorsalis]|uniref:flavin-containing monooxygenase FMO GS-OX-like 7 n=1 Tax=Seriola lalandi dorsalis TaxID=1841481 RepID=UPI000C6FA4E1